MVPESDLNGKGGYHVDVTTDLEYTFKGSTYTDAIRTRYMHLSSINSVPQNMTIDSVLGIGGNSGLNKAWNRPVV